MSSESSWNVEFFYVLYQLDLSLLEILFVYTIKMSPKELFNLSTHILPFQFITGFPNSNKWWTKERDLVFNPWSGSIEEWIKCSSQNTPLSYQV